MENFMYAAAQSEAKSDHGPVEQEDLTVRGAATGGYNAWNERTANKSYTPIMDTPFSIKVAPQRVLRDQQVVNIFRSLLNEPSVIAWGATQNVAVAFIGRGFTNHQGFLPGRPSIL